MKRYLGIDLETFSATDLTACGVHRYVEDPEFAVLLFGFAWDEEPVKVLDLTAGEHIPEDVLEALTDPGVIKSAWNAPFEMTCLRAALGLDIDPAQWEDTMVLAGVCGLPLGLGDAGRALGLPEDKAKDRDGKALIRWFCVPCKPTKKNPGTRHLPEAYPEKWERFKAYNGQDVVAEREIRLRLARWAPSGVERRAWAVDQAINNRGVRVDLTLASAAVELDRRNKAELTEQAMVLTGLQNPNSVAQIKTWLMEQEGVEVPSLNKKVLPDVIAGLSTDRARQFMDLRAELAKSSTKKYDAVLRSACADEHIRGCFQFYGASRTGRWCLTGDHEVLTPKGWVRLDAWTGGNIICWNRSSDQLSFQKSNPLSFPYSGEMVKITGQRCAQVSTPDHKMAVADYKGVWSDKTARELVGKTFRIPFTGYRQKPVYGPSVSAAELRVLVMTQADGHYTHDGCLRFHFRKDRKVKRCKSLLRRAGLLFSARTNGDDTTTISILARHLPIWLRQFQDKTYGPWLLNEDPGTFFDELEHWDAYRCGPNSIQYSTTNRQNADMIQALAVTSGLSATQLEKPRSNSDWNTAYIVNIWLTPGPIAKITGKQTETCAFTGTVYCAETPTGYFMVRREGKVWITGNSGRRVQLQNLAKNKMKDLGPCRALARSGDYETTKLLYDGVSSVLSELVRTTLIPEQGHRFIVCDYSAIEARVLAWIAGEEWALEEFRGAGQIYEATGAKMFNVPKETIAKGGANHDKRQAAKTAVLACVAEGQLVLTERGPVPIEKVSAGDRVWDGVEWVHHDGLVRRGRKETVRVNGVELTEDHKILTTKGMIACGEAEGLDWAAIRFPDGAWAGGAEAETERREGSQKIETYDLLNAGPRHRFCLVDRETGALRCVSNCGYGGGVNALLAFGADKMGMTEEDMVRTVDLWREANHRAVLLWKDLERTAIRCVVRQTPQRSKIGGIRFDYESGILWMTLPSGRRIAYFGARYGESRWHRGRRTLSYMGTEQKTGRWARLETWGGKLTENLVQATARDCLRDAMIALSDAGFEIRAHIHDEVVISEPKDGRTLEDVAEIMSRPLSWAPGLPLRGDGYYCDYYVKD